jgi:hypothetical protein
MPKDWVNVRMNEARRLWIKGQAAAAGVSVSTLINKFIDGEVTVLPPPFVCDRCKQVGFKVEGCKECE